MNGYTFIPVWATLSCLTFQTVRNADTMTTSSAESISSLACDAMRSEDVADSAVRVTIYKQVTRRRRVHVNGYTEEEWSDYFQSLPAKHSSATEKSNYASEKEFVKANSGKLAVEL